MKDKSLPFVMYCFSFSLFTFHLKKKLMKVEVNFSIKFQLGTDWGRYFEIGTRTKVFSQSRPNFGPCVHFCLIGDGVKWH